MQAIFTVAFPVFALIFIGWLAGRRRMLGPGGTAALNGFVTWFALPAMLFLTLSRASFAAILNWPFVAIHGGAMLITFLAGMAAARFVSRADPVRMSIHGLTAAFGNVGYMGIPLCAAAFGPQGILPATLAVCIGGAGMMTVSIIVIEFARNRGATVGATVGRAAFAVVRSPILQAVALGMLFAALDLPVPAPIARFLELLGTAAGPCALFAIGHFMADQGLPEKLGEVVLATLGKMILQPIATIALLALFPGLPDLWWKSALLLSALPGASSSFVLAKEYDSFVDGASATILLSTAMSVVTVSAMVVLLGLG